MVVGKRLAVGYQLALVEHRAKWCTGGVQPRPNFMELLFKSKNSLLILHMPFIHHLLVSGN